ncbi:MAG: hypothetical protein LBM02_10360 [Lachnospiraceae bacterium]|nr:hypothetical protein [Lachnospiraceae bacterium]
MSGKYYDRAMQKKLIFRQTVVRHDVPKHITDNFNRFVALYDLRSWCSGLMWSHMGE